MGLAVYILWNIRRCQSYLPQGLTNRQLDAGLARMRLCAAPDVASPLNNELSTGGLSLRWLLGAYGGKVKGGNAQSLAGLWRGR